MPTKKKKFIDKKNAVSFHLVHRSQRDPLQVDERAPKHVLLEKNKDDDALKKRKEEENSYGIYFDDDYNYLQHLKDPNKVVEWEPVVERFRIHKEEPQPSATAAQLEPSLYLPSSVFASAVEETEGILNKAAPHRGPHPDWDPDIVAALDDDFNFEDPENQLEDDFITLANEPADSDYRDSKDDSEGYLPSDETEDLNSVSDGQWSFEEEETKSRFTNYSMTSSVLPRSEALQTLDERFEKLFEQYDDDGIGALDGDDIAGYLNTESRIVNQLVEDYQAHKQQCTLKEFIKNKFEGLEVVTVDQSESEEPEKKELVNISINETSKEEQWDCKSILSTYSNLYNHPKLITERKSKPKPVVVSERLGVPVDAFDNNKLTKRHLRQLNEENHDIVSKSTHKLRSTSAGSRNTITSTIRPKDETPEERKARKCTVKQCKKERRAEKKANKLAFKMEEKRQLQIAMNLRQNLQCIKLN